MASIWAQAKQQYDATNPPPPDSTSVWAQLAPDAPPQMASAAPHVVLTAPAPPGMSKEPKSTVWAQSTPERAPGMTSAAPMVTLDQNPEHQQIAHDQNVLTDLQKPKTPWKDLSPGRKIARVFADIGNVGGDIFAPATMAMIPGTDLNRQRQEGYYSGRLAKELDENAVNQNRAAETAKTEEETKEAPGEAAAREGAENAQASVAPSEIAKNNAEIYGLENPWAKMPENQPLQGVDQINKGMADRYQVLHPGAALPGEFTMPANATKGDFDRVDKLMTAEETAAGNQANREQSNKLRETMLALAMQNAGEKNLWSVPQPDGTSKVVSLRPGDTVPKGAVSLSGQSSQNAKAGGADVQASLSYANDYLQSGAFTGPGDEALQDQFFNLAKPSTGFRMNQAQIDQLHNMASWMDSWRGKAYHAINGVWFAPEQRRQIVATMNALAASKGIEAAASKGGPTQSGQHSSPNAGDIVDGYRFKGGDPSEQKNWEKAK